MYTLAVCAEMVFLDLPGVPFAKAADTMALVAADSNLALERFRCAFTPDASRSNGGSL